MSIFKQKMQIYWYQLKEQIRLADEFVRNHQAAAGLKTKGGVTDDPSATTTGSNPDTPDGSVDGTPDGAVDGTPDGAVDGTPGNQQGNDPSPTSTTPPQGSGESSTTNSTTQNGSVTP